MNTNADAAYARSTNAQNSIVPNYMQTLSPVAKSTPAWNVPKLEDCDPGIRPVEYQVLVRMSVPPEKTAGGLIMPDTVKEREAYGATLGRLVALSPFAFTYARERPKEPGDNVWPEGAKPKVGDVVHTGKYPGEVVIGRDGEEYHLIRDREVGAVMEQA